MVGGLRRDTSLHELVGYVRRLEAIAREVASDRPAELIRPRLTTKLSPAPAVCCLMSWPEVEI